FSTLFQPSLYHPHLNSFPTRRSSDLQWSEPHVGFDGFNRTARQFRLGTLLDYPSDAYTLQLVADSSFTVRLGDTSGKSSPASNRSEEHTSELQSLRHLVCRLLLEKKK